jgi:GT2 family glycosyltransferase
VNLSVVIPTRDRWAVLDGTLDALARQDPGGAAVEVVVVNNGAPGAPAVGRRPFPVRVVDEPRPGAAAARNAGIAAARGQVILFLGDDCRPVGDGFFAGHLADRSPWTAVVGGIEPSPDAAASPFMRWLSATGMLIDSRSSHGDWRSFYTGNASVSREALLAVAGFDERFSGYGWEDADLALRLADHGLRVEHRPGLLVHHAHEYDLDASLGRMEAVGRSAHLLERLHDHRRPLPGPAKGRGRLAFARGLGPVVPRRAWRAAHLVAYARGHAAPPLPDDPRLRGYGRFGLPGGDRPPVSVVVPFLGSPEEGEELALALRALRVRDGDEVIVVDNGAQATLPGGAVHAPEQASSYYARNAGADRASGEWLLFLDADCRPRPTLIDDYFAERIDERCGAIAGRVMAAPGQDALVARYARSRGHLSQAAHMRDDHLPYGITANLLVRRAAFDELGGFQEGLRSGGDADLCWRLQDAGWTIAYREPAAVEHLHRESVAALGRQAARYSAAIAWMERHRPGSSPRPRVARRLARAAAGAVAWTAVGRFERAAFKVLDGVVVVADGAGWLFSNAAPQRGEEPSGGGALVVDAFPDAEAPVGAVAHAHPAGLAPPADGAAPGSGLAPHADGPPAQPAGPLRVEAARRPARLDRAAARGLRVRYAEDDGVARRAIETLALRLRARGADAPAARRLARAGVEWIAAAAGAEGRAATIARAISVPLAPAPDVDNLNSPTVRAGVVELLHDSRGQPQQPPGRDGGC